MRSPRRRACCCSSARGRPQRSRQASIAHPAASSVVRCWSQPSSRRWWQAACGCSRFCRAVGQSSVCVSDPRAARWRWAPHGLRWSSAAPSRCCAQAGGCSCAAVVPDRCTGSGSMRSGCRAALIARSAGSCAPVGPLRGRGCTAPQGGRTLRILDRYCDSVHALKALSRPDRELSIGVPVYRGHDVQVPGFRAWLRDGGSGRQG